MIQPIPKMTKAFEKKHSGKSVIAWNGKIIGMGKDAVEALEEAKKVMPDIEDKECLLYRIFHGIRI